MLDGPAWPADTSGMETKSDELLSVSQVAELLGCHHQTVRRYLRTGELPRPIRIGGRVYLARRDFDEFLDSKKRTSA